MLRGFTNNGPIRKGKYIKIEYADREDFEPYLRIVDDSGKLLTGLEFKAGKNWKTFPFTKDNANPYEITDKTTEQGDIQLIAVSGTIQDVNITNILECKNMKKAELVVVITLQNGKRWLISDPDNFAKFEYSFDGGKSGSDVPKLKFTLKSNLPYEVLEL
jgi:hypothetical protein